jgi:hypothetical protein
MTGNPNFAERRRMAGISINFLRTRRGEPHALGICTPVDGKQIKSCTGARRVLGVRYCDGVGGWRAAQTGGAFSASLDANRSAAASVSGIAEDYGGLPNVFAYRVRTL